MTALAKTLHADVVLALDERSARQVSSEIEGHIGDSANRSGDAFNRTLGSKIAGGARDAGQSAGRELRAGITSGIDDAVRQYTSSLGVIGNAGNAAFSTIRSSAGMAALGVAGIGVAAVAVGKQLYDLGAQWDDIADGITGRTGKMGDELDGIVESVKKVGQTTAVSLGDIGNIAGGVSQSLHLTGDDLTRMTEQVASLQQVTGQAVDTKQLGKTFRLFDIDGVEGQIDALNHLLTMSQDTDVPINSLLTTMQQAGKTAQQFGLDFGQTAGLLGAFEDAGLDAEKTSTGLSLALKNLAKDGQDPVTGLQQTVTEIQRLHDAGQETAAINLATSTFGKGYVDFLNAIESGNLDVEKLHTALTSLGDDDAIDKQKKATEDWHEEWVKLKNTFSSALAPAASGFFGMVNDWLTRTTQPLKDFADTMDRIKTQGWGAGFHSDFTGPNGYQWPGLGGGPGASAARRGDRQPPGTTTPGLLQQGLDYSGFQSGWNDRTPGNKASGPKLPDAPVLPYDTSLPPGFAGLPQTSSIVAAEQAWMDARHTLAEKNARVTQLESDANAKAEDIQKARNDVINAQQAQQQAELRLNDARQSLYDKANKQLSSYADQMGDIGAKLDQDFGISKGLPGIAENLFKFLANLAAAPIEGMLGAIGRRNPNEGSGLVGILAAQGAFGQQYTPGAITASQATNSGGAYGAGAALGLPAPSPGIPGAALPGESARDFAHRVMMPFWQQQGFTVGDHAADKYGEHQNGALDIMVPSIAKGNQVLQQVLSDPNVYGAIFNNQTYGYGHGLTPRDYSAGHTGNPTQDHQDHVHAWYKPGNPGDITPGGYAPVAGGTGVSTTSLSSGGTTPVYVTNWPGGGSAALTIPGLSPDPGSPSAASAGGSPIAPTVGGISPTYPALTGPALTNPGLTPAPGGGGGTGPGLPGIGPVPQSAPLGLGQQPPSVGGPGMNVGGGLVGAAEGAAAMAADAFMPGTGALVQIGSQILNKAIEFGGKVAGIGVSEIGDFFSIGDNPRASLGNSWLGRMAGGIAGAKPALPNLAGKKPPDAMTGDQASKPAAGGGQGGNTFNTTVNNNRATEDGTGRDLNRHLEAMTAAPGRQ